MDLGPSQAAGGIPGARPGVHGFVQRVTRVGGPFASCPRAFEASKAMMAEGDLVWAVWNAVRVAYRSGSRPFAPHGTRNTD